MYSMVCELLLSDSLSSVSHCLSFPSTRTSFSSILLFILSYVLESLNDNSLTPLWRLKEEASETERRRVTEGARVART